MRRFFTGTFAVTTTIIALVAGTSNVLAAFVPGDAGQVNETQVRTAVDRGHAWLLTQQLSSGCWTSDGFIPGVTALAMLALINSEPGGYAGLDAASQAAVQSGAACLVTYQLGSGQFNDPCCELWVYSTSTAIWALSGLPGTAYSTNITNGRNWLLNNQCNDGTGRADLGGSVNNGGWHYEGGCDSGFVEHSNSSFALQGLEATGGIPAAVKDLAEGFWICLQRLSPYPVPGCAAGGGPFNDGGFIYSHQINKGGTETSATGSGSFSLSLTGVPNGDPRIAATIQYLDASIGVSPCENNFHTADSLTTGWFSTDTLRHYAVWANFKAHVLAGIPDSLSDASNWYFKLADCLVNESIASAAGNWPPNGREDAILATSFAMLTLEKVTPEPPITNATGVPFSAVEGANNCGSVATFDDADQNAAAGDYTATIAWGDTTSSGGTVVSGGNGHFTVTGCHTYAEEGTYQITVTITDADNASNTATVFSTATVVDAVLTASPACSATSLLSYNGRTATFIDAASPFGTLSDFSATINWGDGTPATSGTVSGADGGPYSVAGSHTYATTGTFTITTTITDVGGSTAVARCNTLEFAFAPGGGTFVIGDKNAAVGNSVTFWGAQWAKINSLSGGSAPASFKGFAENPKNPACSINWSADTGSSTPPPSGPLPAYMGVIVTSSASQNGSTISGNAVSIAIVKTDPGYAPNTGHAGTGTVVAVVAC